MLAHYSRDVSTLGAPETATTQAADIQRCIREGLRGFYSSHRWSYLRSDYSITTSPPQSSSTITGAAGVLTIAAGSWPTWAADGFLYVNGRGYEVDVRTDSTHLLLVDTTFACSAGTAYVIRRFTYELPTDFTGFDSPLCYAPGESNLLYKLSQTSEYNIRRAYQWNLNIAEGQPKAYALVTRPYAAASGELRAICVSPPSNSTYHLTAERYIMPFDLDATNIYPAGGALYGNAIMEAVLSQVEIKLQDNRNGPHTAAYQEELAKAIANDRKLSSPESIGGYQPLPEYLDSEYPGPGYPLDPRNDNFYVTIAGQEAQILG